MLAPSFQSFEVLTEPFDKNGRKYVRVRNPSTGKEREVRFYTDQEYERQYGEKKTHTSSRKTFKNLARTLGFERGFIYVFKDWNPKEEMFLKEPDCRFHTSLGWYVPSTTYVPSNLPMISILLQEQAFTDKKLDTLKEEAELKKIIKRLK